jgi:hypothetical protein
MSMPPESTHDRLREPTEQRTPDSGQQRLSTADFAAAAEHRPVQRKGDDQRTSERAPLFAEHEAGEFRTRWTDIQASFVDQPRQSVEQADTLVAAVMQRLARVFADERQQLERQWDRGGETNTEELRLALQRYRSFFDRLLTMSS